MKFREFSFYDLLENIVDNRGRSCPTSEYGIPLIATNCIQEKSIYPTFEKIRFVSQETFDTWFRGHPKPEDIIFVCKGSPGGVSWFDKPGSYCIAQDMVSIRADKSKIDSKFLFALLRSKQTQKKINNMHVGTLIPHFKKGDFKHLFFDIPDDMEYQRFSGNVYFDFCKKIELLREQNKTLETLAQTIFKEWFVKFNFPDATGEMIDSELGEIPKGWKIFRLNELVDTVNGYSYKGKELIENSNEALVTLKSFNRNGGFQTRGFKPFKGNPKSTQEVVIGDLVVAHTDLTQDAEVLGNPAFVFESGGFEKMYITMDLVKVASKMGNIDNAFLYYVMKDRRFKGHCIGYSNGTTVLHLSKKAIPEYEIALPEDLKLAERFSKLALSTTDKISNNILQIQSLEKTRDTLLPKLMSGNIRVN